MTALLPNSPFDELGTRVAGEIDQDPRVVLDDRRRFSQRARLSRLPRRRSFPALFLRPVVVGSAATLMVALAIVGGTYWFPQRGAAQAMQATIRGGRTLIAGDWVEADRNEAQTIDFGEGSALTLAPGSRLRIHLLEADRVHLALEDGRLHSRVNKGAKWTISAGPCTVHVIGTRFAIAWSSATKRMRTEVEKGIVRVDGGVIQSGGIKVGGGQRLDTHLRTGDVRLSRWSPGEDAADGHQSGDDAGSDILVRDAQAVDGTVMDESMADTSATKRRMRRTNRARRKTSLPGIDYRWRVLAESGDYTGAATAAIRAGYGILLTHVSAADLLLLADATRLAGDAGRAKRALVAFRRRFPGHPMGLSAAFRLGRLAADARDYVAAVRWFRRFLNDSNSTQGLAGDARGRLMIALQRLGDLSAARLQARRYLALHPDGPYTESARALANEP